VTVDALFRAAHGPVAKCMLGVVAVLALCFAPLPALADAGTLRARHVELQEQLRSNHFQRAMHIDSTESAKALQGDVYAVLDHSFEKVKGALSEPGPWCDIMILPFNTKYCHAIDKPGEERLVVRIGRKVDQPVEQAFRLDLQFRNLASSADYFESRLSAAEGPFGTRDYRITVSAVPLDSGKTFLHLSYAYGVGTVGRIAMQAYLASAGAHKIGFTVTGKDPGGQPQFIGGVRGAVERNAMRYYLAIDAYLGAMDTPADQRVERRIQSWFSATERYPRQLREMDRATYVAMKRQEYERQQTAAIQ